MNDSIAASLLVAIVEHDAKGKFVMFLQDKRLEQYRRGEMSKEEYYCYANGHQSELNANVMTRCTLERIYEAYYGKLPDLSEYVEKFVEAYKKGYGWERN